MEVLETGKMKKKATCFVKERDWDKFQTPKNISMALSIEASELMELFLWLTEEESTQISENAEKMVKIKEEIADVFYWLLRLSDLLNIDLNESFWEKMKKNELKYPIELCKGKAKKYTEL